MSTPEQSAMSIARQARARAPRSAHAGWEPAASRADPVALLESQGESRVPELLPIRYGRMARSPLSFLRGSAAIMAADLAHTPTSGLRAQLCGDAHLSNFGGFASPDREIVFDLNDFDETLPGPFEWDVKRLAASLHVAALELSFTSADCRAAALTAADSYAQTIRSLARMGNLEVWYARLPARQILRMAREEGVSPKRRRTMRRNIAKARGKESRRAAGRLTERVDGHLRFVSDPPLVVPIDELLDDAGRAQLEEALDGLLSAYRASLPHDRRRLFDGYRHLSIARKVVGVGSVGTRAWIVLLAGREDSDPLVLQCKEARESVLEPHAGASGYANHGQRVVEGQRLMQAASDIFLGWMPAIGLDGSPRDFYLRQLWDGKLSPDIESMTPQLLSGYAQLCGWTLARAHARSGDRGAIAAYLGRSRTFAEAIADFAAAYAEQNARDHAALLEAISSGRIESVDL